jgi:hypothetical protein
VFAAPGTPTIGTVTVTNDTTVSVPFTAGSTGNATTTAYTVTSSPSISLTYSGTTSPFTVTGTFASNQAYTFTISATNKFGTSSASSASNSVTPLIPSYIAVATEFSPWRDIYPWSNATGFGTRYANSSAGQAFRSTDITFSPSSDTIITTSTGPNYAYAFPWSASGFGTQYGSPSLPNQTNGVAFNPAGNVVAFGYVGGSRATVYPWNPGFGTAYSTPFLGRDGQRLTFSPSGNAIAITVDNASEPLKAFPWSNSTGFGTRYAEVPAQTPAYGAGSGLAFNSAGNTISFAHQSMQRVSTFPWNPGVGTKYADPSPALTNAGSDVAFNPAGNVIAVTGQDSPYFNAWPWGPGYGTKYTSPGNRPTGGAYGVKFHKSGNSVAFAASTSPYIFVYPWSNATGFGTRYASPATLPSSTAYSIAFG